MNVANVDFHHTLAFRPLDDLHMGQRPRNPVTHFGTAPAISLTAGAVRLSENLREQTGVAGFAVGEQDQLMPIGKPPGRILQQTPDERFIALTLHMRHHKLTHWVDDLRLPLWLAFILGIAMSL